MDKKTLHWFFFSKIVFKNSFLNTENIILVFSENCSYFLNFVFLCSLYNKKTNGNQTVFLTFFLFVGL